MTYITGKYSRISGATSVRIKAGSWMLEAAVVC